MPRYLNSSTSDKTFGQYRIPPGEYIDIEEYISTLPSGITMDNTYGYYNPIIYNEKVTSGKTVTIPATTSAYKVRIYVSTGEVDITLNVGTATTKTIGAGDLWEIKCMNRIIDSIIFTISSGTAYLTVEKI
jgi:hypothetical protein